MTEVVLTNANLVLKDEVIHASLMVRDGKIASIDTSTNTGTNTDISTGNSQQRVDMEGDFILPGFVELHTDHIESHYSPRPKVRWNPLQAAIAHDAQIAASGITTVFDALCLGMAADRLSDEEIELLISTLRTAGENDMLRADHFTHLRCEVSTANIAESFKKFAETPSVRLVSLMDHTPGQRQFTSLEQHRIYYQGKTGMSDAQYDEFVGKKQALASKYSRANRKTISTLCDAHQIHKASHDDATSTHVAEALGDNIAIAEFPTTLEAAKASHKAGMQVLMGAPNVVRGKSHSGNMSALELADLDLLDILSSDYVPMSLLHAAFMLAQKSDQFDLPKAVRTVSLNPAEAVGLSDRGSLEVGKRADLIQVKAHDDTPFIRSVLREGKRVS